MSEENQQNITPSTPQNVSTPAVRTTEARTERDSRRPFSRPGGSSQGGSSFGNRTGFGNRPPRPFGSSKPGDRKPAFGKKPQRDSRRPKEDENSNLESQVILVRRVTRVVKGGKRMRFSALVVVGDKSGKVGYGLKKGLDFQDAVAKATKRAQDTMIKVQINESGSVNFPLKQKFKACEIMLKPAKTGTGLIAGGFLRPVLELAGVKNIYSKIITTRNKVVGVQATFEALKNYSI
jgi:small subunit ribosomal protein S5